MCYTLTMEKEKTQKTPKEEYEIPIPSKEDFEKNLDKATKPVKESHPRSPSK